ncbi:hypothetical protein ACFYWX_19940 [Streptomyces sp. NPDC002888]|uniref:hypothetical protein n=1 Tax=Streptomyces sp. NPDC002888 TaxID=3364668 RepID=UPI003683207E
MAAHEASRTPSRQPQTPPAPLTPAWLRAHFDPLPFPARMSALARYARTLTPHAYTTLHHALDTGDSDDRHTALFLAVVRRDLQRVTVALDDPLLGRRARSAAIRLPVPEHALERLALSDIRATRHDTYRLLRLSRRHALAARLLPLVHERHGPREAAALLPACPADTVTAWLPRVEPTSGTLNSLARSAPHALAAHLAAEHEQCPRPDAYGFVRRHRAVASVAARRDPDAALVLLERAPDLLTPYAVLAALHRPAEALAVLRTPHPDPDGPRRERRVPAGPLPPSLRRTLRALPEPDLVDLARHCAAAGGRVPGPGRHEVTPDGLLSLLPPADRRRIVEKNTTGRGRLRGAPVSTLAALEPSDRAALIAPWLEANRRSPWSTARLASALPLADGEPLLRRLADDHRAHLRALAWPALLACAELEGDPDRFARIAADCERAWHDRDEVRGVTLGQLAGAASHLLAALPDSVLRDAVLTALQSRDSTTGTLGATELLLRRVIERAAATGDRERAAYALGLLGELVAAPRHTPVPTALDVDEATAHAIWEVTSAAAQHRPEVTTALAELLGPHLAVLPDLDAAARRVAVEHDDPHLAARAAAAWVRPPLLREQRCAELIALDATFATVPVVLRTVTTRRTDLLDPLLDAARDAFTGRLRPRATAWTPKVRPGVTGRWLPRQRASWGEHHARVAVDEDASLHTRTDATQLVSDPVRLEALAQEAPQPVAAAALAALGEAAPREGGGSGAAAHRAAVRDLLLRHAGTGGVRGRAAMAAIRRLLEQLPDGEAVALLAPVASAADAPVGTRKEAARALAALPGDDAFEALLAAWDAPRQHADVRAVLARALFHAIDRPGVAGRLLRFAHEPAVREAVVQARVCPVSDSRRKPRTEFLVRLVEEGDADTVVAACQALPAWLVPDASDAIGALVGVVVAPASPRRVWEAAACQLGQLPAGPVVEAIVRGAFAVLGERARAGDPQVRIDALRRLHGCAEVVHPSVGGGAGLPVLDILADTLDAVGLHADAASLSWGLAVDSVRRGQYAEQRWERLVRLSEAGPGRLPGPLHMSLDLDRARVRAAALATARTLRARGTAVSGLLALTLVRAGGQAAAWDEPWRAELMSLRAHTDPDTAMGALLVDADT